VPTEPTRGAQAVYRALNVLECFTVEESSLSLAQISRRLDLPGPTVHRLLKALEQHQMIAKDREAQRYSLGPGVMRLAHVVQQESADVVAIAAPSLERLRASTTETVGLHLPMSDRRVCVAELVSFNPVKMASGSRQTYPLHAGAAGKALLAWEPAVQVEQILESVPRGKRAALRHELEEVRSLGYAISQEETVTEASAIAAAVLDYSGRPVAAINVTGPLSRWTVERMLEHVDTLQQEATAISEQLGYEDSAAPAGSAR
jgi:DNA-binding IclR family transcriptional regulator